MGGTTPTFVPYPTFHKRTPANGEALSAVGRCRINPLTCTPTTDEFKSIFEKNVEQSQVDDKVKDAEKKAENKKLKKKYMKQGAAMAQSFLTETLKLDVSIVDVEILIDASMIIQTEGCIAACFLDAGCAKIAVIADGDIDSMLQAMDTARVPKDRIVAHLSEIIEDSTISAIADFADSISVALPDADTEKCLDIVKRISKASTSLSITLQISSGTVDSTPELVSTVNKYFMQKETPNGTMSLVDPSANQLGLSYVSCIRTDRSDGLFTTVVCTRAGEALGLVYSSKESVVAALECGRGVYYSRSRNGLWRKGDTSGHYQTLHRIDVDCDGDALRFCVTQRGDDCAAFCHLNTLTCWGIPNGLRHLEGTLQDRLHNAPAGSYTKRLFEDSELLRDKLVEEAQELSEADTKQHVAEELADVFYFAMVKAAKAGVSIDDAIAELDKRTRKVTRRKGDSKAFRIEAGNQILNKE